MVGEGAGESGKGIHQGPCGKEGGVRHQVAGGGQAELVYSHRLHVLHSCSKQDKHMRGIGGRSACQ